MIKYPRNSPTENAIFYNAESLISLDSGTEFSGDGDGDDGVEFSGGGGGGTKFSGGGDGEGGVEFSDDGDGEALGCEGGVPASVKQNYD